MSSGEVKLHIVVDVNELTVRILERLFGMKRPAGKSPREIVDTLEQNRVVFAKKVAMIASDYFVEVLHDTARSVDAPIVTNKLDAPGSTQ